MPHRGNEKLRCASAANPNATAPRDLVKGSLIGIVIIAGCAGITFDGWFRARYKWAMWSGAVAIIAALVWLGMR